MKLNKTAALLTIIIVLSFTTIIQQIQIFSLQSRFDVVESESGMRYSGNPFTTALYQGQLQAENITWMHQYVYRGGSLFNRTDVVQYPEQTATFVIFKDSAGNVYAKNTTSGQIQFGGAWDAGGVDGANASAVIQAANDALGTTKDSILIKSGDYTITSTLSISPHVLLIGEGMENTRLIGSSGVDVIEVNVGGSSSRGGGIKQLSIRPEGTAVGLKVEATYHYKIEDIYFRASSTTYNIAINISSGSHISNIQNCYFLSYTDYAISIYANGVTVSESHFKGQNGSISVFVDSTAGAANIHNNYFEYGSGNGGTHIKIDGSGCRAYSNNLGAAYTSTSMAVFITGSNGYRNEVFDNWIEIPSGGGYGVYINSTSTTSSNSVHDNNIWHNGQQAIYVDTVGTVIHHNKIIVKTTAQSHAIVLSATRIKCDDNFIFSYDLTEAVNTYGIFVEGLRDRMQITNNFIRHMNKGISLNGDESEVIGNQIFDCTTGIAISGNNHVIKSNIIRGATTAIALGGSGHTIQGNIGFVTENWVSFTNLSNGSYVAHGLAGTPDYVTVTLSTKGYGWYGAKNSTHVQLYFSTSTASGTVYCKYEP